jgi:hypothetical protein
MGLLIVLALVGCYLASADSQGQGQGLVLIGAGFARTGTTSTMVALEQLGFGEVHHMKQVVQRWEFGLWGDIAHAETTEERRALLRKAMAGYRSSIDFPSSRWYKDLMALYPDAKVLLTTRSAESWCVWMSACVCTVPCSSRRGW